MDKDRPVLRVGFAGAGNFAAFLAETLTSAAAMEIGGVFDPGRGELPEVFARTSRHGSLAELLAEPIDVVVVAGPPSSHAETAVAALHAGKHVLLEKPMALEPSDGLRIVRAERETGCKVQVDHVLRFSPMYAALTRLSDLKVGGTSLFGPVRRYAFENDASDEWLPRDHWFWDRRLSGGIAVEHGIHFIEGCSMLKPESPIRVQAVQTGWAGDGAVDTVVITAAYADGATATYAHAFTHHSRAEMQLTRIDWGWAKAMIEGWIPVRAAVSVWSSERGAQVLAECCAAPDLLASPAQPQSPEARVTVRTQNLEPQFANSRSGVLDLSVHSEVILDLGGPDAKKQEYQRCVVGAYLDLVNAIAENREPICSARRSLASLAVAAAAQRAATTGQTVAIPSSD